MSQINSSLNDEYDMDFYDKLLAKKVVVARDFYAILDKTGKITMVDIFKGNQSQIDEFFMIVDVAAGFDHFIGLRKDGMVVTGGPCNQTPQARVSHWLGDTDGIAVYSCEGHSALLKRDASVRCIDYYGMDTQGYKSTVESWKNVQQLALTFDEPYALTKDGKFLCRNEKVNNFFNDCDEQIIQIAAFGCYYSQMTVAALYANGMVKAFYGFLHDYDIIKGVFDWKGVKKICCGGHAAVFALTNEGKVLFPYDDNYGKKIRELEDIEDIAANFNHFVALKRHGKIICLNDK